MSTEERPRPEGSRLQARKRALTEPNPAGPPDLTSCLQQGATVIISGTLFCRPKQTGTEEETRSHEPARLEPRTEKGRAEEGAEVLRDLYHFMP